MKRLINYKDREDGENKGTWLCGAKIKDNDIPNEKVFKKLLKQYRGDLYQYFSKKDKEIKKSKGLLSHNKHWGDKGVFKCIIYKLEIIKFANVLSHNQVIQILELMISQLNPVDKKVFFLDVVQEFDYVDIENHTTLDRMKKEIVNDADYTDDEFYERNEYIEKIWYEGLPTDAIENENRFDKLQRQEDAISKVKNNPIESKFEDEDFEKFYDESDYIVAYRGFVSAKDRKIRVLDLHTEEEKEQFTPDFIQYLKRSQGLGRGISFSLDKHTAMAFAFRSLNFITHNSNDEEVKDNGYRAVVGQYLIKKTDIFAYNNNRTEREVLLISNDPKDCDPVLLHYEFLTNTSFQFDKSGLDSQPSFRDKNIDADLYAKQFKDTKINKIFNKKVEYEVVS